ncbi:hypothetical protein IKF86_02575 [Candidatus Saccharibacteria bacterium]|nr:hypothetical protein [Candidatus Saccharibacteria bacterium]
MRKIIHTKLHIISRGRFYSSVFSSILIIPLLASFILPSCLVCFLASPINVSALTYSDATNVQFTFNSSLSVSVSGDLYIDELAPGSSSDSNIISVDVVTNNISGYNLFATTGSISNATTNLTHTNNTNIFSSLDVGDNYSSFNDQDIDPNTWGYSYSTNNGTTWSNYSGLPVYTLSGTTLKESTSASNDTVNFKIAAKASADQAAGDYSNIINFTAIANKAPVSFYDAYKANNKTMYNGYYTMQDMSTSICETVDIIGEDSQTKLIDIRDNNTYWVAKLVDGNCWMTQNLNFAPLPTETYTYYDTDLGHTTNNVNETWTPDPETMSEPAKITNFAAETPSNSVIGWLNNSNRPYYAEGRYYDTATESLTDDEIISYFASRTGYNTKYQGITACAAAHHAEIDCEHYQVGNYYNWPAAIASNNASNIVENYTIAPNSICSAGWKLPKGITNSNGTIIQSDYNKLFGEAGITNGVDLTGYENVGYTENGWHMINVAHIF